MNDIAIMIAEDLHFNMQCILNQFFEKYFVLAKRGVCLLARTLHRFVHSLEIPDNPHAATAAAPTGLQHQGEPDCFGNLFRFLFVPGQRTRRRHHCNAGLDG